jgi:hypothetical protein
MTGRTEYSVASVARSEAGPRKLCAVRVGLAVFAVAACAACSTSASTMPVASSAPIPVRSAPGTASTGAAASTHAADSPAIASTPTAAGTAGTASTRSMAGVVAGASASARANQPGAAGSASGAAPPEAALPCSVSKALASNCQKCHGATPIFGAPMPLVSNADLHKPSAKDASISVAQAAVKRLNDAAAPMPPGANITDSERKLLVDYLTSGAAPAQAAGETCDVSATRSDEYLRAGLKATAGETCYEFTNHASQEAGDKTKYSVKAGEHYEEFYFKVPWGAGMVATKFGSKLDNIKVAHHWLFYTTSKAVTDGSHATTVGSTLGDTATLLAGWAVGGDNLIFPEDMGLELPASGMLNAQWHYYNQGDSAEPDASAIQVCVVPRAMKKNVAGVTFLGSEDFNGFLVMPAHTVSKYGGSCLNDSGAPITIWGFTPHMHKLGRHMTSVIKRKDGTLETAFDRTFDFNAQITYPLDPQIVLQPGDTITSTCTFDNTTDRAVPFGPSTNQEMCYNFAISYPLKALDNGVASLAGALNTCW